MDKVCNFDCKVSCSETCCSGSTMICLDELKDLKDKFVLTLTFFMENGHPTVKKNYKQMNGFSFLQDNMTIFNFSSANSGLCPMLDIEDKKCKLHETGIKPLQCKIMPFEAVYGEDDQYEVFQLKRKLMPKCEGFLSMNETDFTVVKNGKYTDSAMRDKHFAYRSQVSKLNRILKPIAREILHEVNKILKRGAGVKSDGNVITIPMPFVVYLKVFEYLGLSDNEVFEFIETQRKVIEQTITTQTEYYSKIMSLQMIILKALEDFYKGEDKEVN